MNKPATLTRVTGVTAEQLLSAVPAVLYAIIPEAALVGTITVRDGKVADGAGTTKHVLAIAGLPAGKQFGPDGVRMETGLTVQPSSASDSFGVVWARL